MENLDRIIAAYKKMDQQAKKMHLREMERSARLYPAKEVVRLRLIKGKG